MVSGEVHAVPEGPPERLAPTRSVRLLTSWKLWTLALLLALAGIAAALVQPILARKQAIEYFQRLEDRRQVRIELKEGAEEWTERFGAWGAGFQEVDYLSVSGVHDEDLRHIGVLPVRSLVLREYPRDPSDSEPLAERGCATLRGVIGLENLFLYGPGFSDHVVAEILAGRPPLRSAQFIFPAGRETIQAVSHLSTIELLTVRGELADEMFPGLDPLPRLERVELNGVGDHAAAWLGQSLDLTFISLTSSTLTDAGLRQLCELPALESLGIEGASISSDGLREFVVPKPFRRLAISNCPGIAPKDIVDLPELSHLESVSLSADLLTIESVERLKQMPGLRVLICVGKVEDAQLRDSMYDNWNFAEHSQIPSEQNWRYHESY